jgi:hypothetical protein
MNEYKKSRVTVRRPLVVLGIVGALLLAGGIAAASIPDAGGRVFTCIAPNGSIVAKDDAGTGSVTCPRTQQQVALAEYRSGVLYGLHEVTASEQVPLSYSVGDFVAVNVTCPYMDGSTSVREVVTGAGGAGPQDFVLQNVNMGPTGAQVVLVAVSTAHVGQINSATAQIMCAKVTP